jgi:hypothetical protein
MPGKHIGDPCPKCAATLIRRRRASLFRAADGDVAYCAPCHAAWDIVGESETPEPFAEFGLAVLRPAR